MMQLHGANITICGDARCCCYGYTKLFWFRSVAVGTARWLL